jgi:replicative DNA helicase Mcm
MGERTFGDVVKSLIPLSSKQSADVENLYDFLEEDLVKDIKKLVRMRKVGVSYESFYISKTLFDDFSYPQIYKAKIDKKIDSSIKAWNDKIQRVAKEMIFEKFSKIAEDKIFNYVAPNILGLDEIKKAAVLQLFSPERTHMLLLGDPGTGKTDVLRSVDIIAPISSFGLGSGTSGVGLSASKRGKELIKGLLPLAHDGICCIDELNLMKESERGSLLNAMEKGFVTYDKGNTHVKLDANVKLLATANPDGDRFVGRSVEILKKQVPFDPALTSRFHLVFMIRRPDDKEFAKIAEKIIEEHNIKLKKEDVDFIRGYIEFANKIEVEFDKKLGSLVTEFVRKLRKDENQFLVDISPRLVIGIVRLAQASARIELRDKVKKEDILKVFDIVKKALYIDIPSRV